MSRYQLLSAAGVAFTVAAAWLFSRRRKDFPWRTVLWALALQFVFAVLVMKLPPGRWFFLMVNSAVLKLLHFQEEGARFVFGTLALSPQEKGSMGFYFAFQVLPTIIFLSSLMSVLYYCGVMQKVVLFFARIMASTCRTSGAESLCASANIFMGQTEAPLLIRPYLESMTESELLCVMVGGMATVAAGIMVAYVGLLSPYYPDIAGQLMAASVMAAPATLAIAKVLIPETGRPQTMGRLPEAYKEDSANVLDSMAGGAAVGLQLALNVAAMLIAFLAMIAMANWALHRLFGLFGHPEIGFETLLSWLFAPVSWIVGVPWNEAPAVGRLIGEKMMFNEFIAYSRMAADAAGGHKLSYRAYVIAAHALCGFGNFLSIGIQIGGLSPLAPSRRADVARLGLYALLGGSLATLMTAAVSGMLIP